MATPRPAGTSGGGKQWPKTPKQLTDEVNPSHRSRLFIVLAFPLVMLIGLPWWWYTTSIERLPLPASRIAALESTELVDVRTPVLLSADLSAIPEPAPGRATYTHEEALERLAKEVTKGAEGILGQQPLEKRGKRWWDLVVDPKGIVHPMRIHIRSTDRANDSFPLRPYIQAQESGLTSSGVPAGTCVIPVHPSLLGDGFLSKHYQIALVKALDALLPSVQSPPDIPLRALKYGPNVTLSFVLLNEDATQGSYVRSWDIEAAINRHFQPHLEALKDVHNFMIESQVLYHAPLSFDPIQENGTWLVSDEDMKIFVNSEKWTLDSGSTNNPVLRFLLFAPSATHRPMRLSTADSADSFLLPQYGAVAMLDTPDLGDTNEAFNLPSKALEPSFHLFTQHLYSLLALPTVPAYIEPSLTHSKHILPDPFTPTLSPWQVERILRMRTKENSIEARKTLAGIVRLVAKIKEMKVGEGVRSKVLGAVEKLEQTVDSRTRFILSRDAVGLANEAFFDPSMMGLLYFPDEHKFAVYTPLFAPIALPIISALLKEFVSWRKRRRAATAGDGPTQAGSQDEAHDTNESAAGAPSARSNLPDSKRITEEEDEEEEEAEDGEITQALASEPTPEPAPSGRVLRSRKSTSRS